MVAANNAFNIFALRLSVWKVWLVLMLLLGSVSFTPDVSGAKAAETELKNSQPKKSKHKARKAKSAMSNSPVIRPKAYPRTNFMPYGYFSAARSQGVDLQAWNRPLPKQGHGTILQSMAKSLGATDNNNSDDELSKLIDSQLGSQQKNTKAAVDLSVKSKKSAADQEKIKIAAKNDEITDSQSIIKTQSIKPAQAIAKSDSSLFADSNSNSNSNSLHDVSSPVLDKATPEVASKAAASVELKNLPLIKNNALLNSVFGKMAAIKFPQIGFPLFSFNLVSIFVALGMALFWLFMIFSALCGSRDRGMRARLSEHKRNDD